MRAILLPILTGAALLAYWRYRDKGVTAPPTPAPASKQPPPKVDSVFDPNYPETGVYKSDPYDCDLHPSGSIEVAGRVWLIAPVIDRRSGLFARFDQPTSAAFLSSRGYRHATEAEWRRLLLEGVQAGKALVLKPCTLVHMKGDFVKMRSLGFQKRHDDCVRKQLDGIGNDWRKVLINCGKQYLLDDRPDDGKQLEFGWFIDDDGGKWDGNEKPIQPPGRAHEDSYTDYSQLTMGVKL